MKYAIEWRNEKRRENLETIVSYLNDFGAHFEEYEDGACYVIPNEYKKLICESNIELDTSFLCYGGKIYKVDSSLGRHELNLLAKKPMITEDGLSAYLNKKKREEETKEAHLWELQETEKRRQETQEPLGEVVESFGEKWRDEAWIEANIGTYCTKDLNYQYYWSLIGDRWRKDANENIQLEHDIYEEISKIEFGGLKGSQFLGRQFKNSRGYNSCITRTTYYLHFGVYCIKTNDDKIVYIGSTMRNFECRFQEHKENFANNSTELWVYREFAGQDIKFEILLDCGQLLATDGKDGQPHIFTENEVRSMELALIQMYKPVGNIAGNKMEFIF